MLNPLGKIEPKTSYGAYADRSPRVMQDDSVDFKEDLRDEKQSESELEMEKLVFNCDERIFVDEHHKLFRNLRAFSSHSINDVRMRIFYHRIFWISIVVIIMLIILRVAFIYASAHDKQKPNE